MRVTQSEIYRNFTSDIGSLSESLNDVSSQLSSGKKLKHLSDSPGGSADLVSITDQALKTEMYKSNIDTCAFFLNTADSALNEANNLVTSIYTLGSQALSSIITAETRDTLATELRSYRDQLISVGNTDANGRYIFAGSEVEAAPFVLVGDSVIFQGNDNVNKVPVGDGLEVQPCVAGSTAFSSVFGAIDTLLASLEGNDLEGITAAMDQFSDATSILNLARGEVGANLGVVQNLSGILDSKKAALTEQRSKIEDADMVSATVQLSQIQTALNASLSAGGIIMQQSNLFDILG